MWLGIKKLLKAFGNWLVDSSTNPESLSLTMKGFIPFLVLLGVNNELLNSTSDSVVNLVVVLGQIVTGVIAVVGFVRKIIISTKAMFAK